MQLPKLFKFSKIQNDFKKFIKFLGIKVYKHFKIINFQIIEKFSMEKETFSTVPGFEPGSFDCRSTVLTN